MTEGPGELMNELSAEFDSLCVKRHVEGQKKYGTFSFLGKDMMEEAIAELIDGSNYLRYQFIKLRMIQMMLAKDPSIAALGDEVTLGAQSFRQGVKE